MALYNRSAKGATGYLYIDAVQVASGSSSTQFEQFEQRNGVSVGGDTYANSTYFNGTIDNVQIYAAAISANGIASLATAAPTIATAAAALPSPVTGTTTALSVLGADDAGESNLTYTWATTGTPPAAGHLFGQRHQRRQGDDRDLYRVRRL